MATKASTDQTWKVGEIAATSGLTVRTLHHWDSIGLLVPIGVTCAPAVLTAYNHLRGARVRRESP